MEPGRLLGPAEIGLLASVGIATVRVVRHPIVAILSTGDELASPGQPLSPGQIYDANTYTLAAAVREAGAEPLVLEYVGDDPEVLQTRLADAIDPAAVTNGADLVLTTAGVSMGDHDFVRAVLEKMGKPEFWQIRMRPGRPLVFGHLRGRDRLVPLVGLPGNPVSALLTFLILVRPAILKMRGLTPTSLPSVEAVLDDRITNEDGRRTFARVTLRQAGTDWHARLTGAQGSALLTSVAAADGLAVVPEDVGALEVGERVNVLLMKGLRSASPEPAAALVSAG
jgi:molybdopterin molybdotransferase